jgi:hypothetical protein
LTATTISASPSSFRIGPPESPKQVPPWWASPLLAEKTAYESAGWACRLIRMTSAFRRVSQPSARLTRDFSSP